MLKKRVSIFVLFFLTISLQSIAQEKILILGDSLTEGYRLNEEDSFPSQLQKIIDEKKGKDKYRVLNGGVSGSTTASGLSRLNWFLRTKLKIVVVALGANDGLRGIELKTSKENLRQIIKLSQEKGIQVVIAGMQIPPNYGKEYTKQFKTLYEDLTKEFKVKQIPFLLKDVAGIKELNLEDGIHPNKKGYAIVAKTVYENIKEFL